MGTLSCWEPLLLLLQAPSKDAVAQLLQVLWDCRRSGLDASHKARFQEQLRLPSVTQLDEVSECLLKLIRKSVYESLNQTDIQELFPPDFHPRLRRLLVDELQKLQGHWREEAVRSQVSLPRVHGMTWETASLECGIIDQGGSRKRGVVNLKVLDTQAAGKMEYDVKFQVSRENLGAMLESLHLIKDQLASMTTHSK